MEYVAQMEKLRECGEIFHELFVRHYPGEKVLEGRMAIPFR